MKKLGTYKERNGKYLDALINLLECYGLIYDERFVKTTGLSGCRIQVRLNGNPYNTLDVYLLMLDDYRFEFSTSNSLIKRYYNVKDSDSLKFKDMWNDYMVKQINIGKLIEKL